VTVQAQIRDVPTPPAIIAGRDGRDALNPEREGELAFWLRAFTYPLPVPVGQALPTSFLVPQLEGAGDMIVRGLVAQSTVPFLCELTEGAARGGLKLQNAPIHHNHMFGGGGRPFELARSLWVPSQDQLLVNVTSRASALAGAVRLVACGTRISGKAPAARRAATEQDFLKRRSRPFWLTNDLTSIALTAGQQGATFNMSMPSGWRLLGDRLLVMAESTGPFEITLAEFEGGRQLMRYGPVDSRLISGDGGTPAHALGMVAVEPLQALQATVNDLSGAANTIFFTLHGIVVPA